MTEINNTASSQRNDDFSFKYVDDICVVFSSVLMHMSVGDSEEDWIQMLIIWSPRPRKMILVAMIMGAIIQGDHTLT